MSDDYEIRIVDQKMLFNGFPVEDIIDTGQRTYSQSSKVDRKRAVALAFRAGQAIHANGRSVSAVPIVAAVD